MPLPTNVCGTLDINQTDLDYTWVIPTGISFARRHEIVAGQTISSATLRALKDGAATSDFTVSSATITGSIVYFTATGVSCTPGDNYAVSCKAVLSGGGTLPVEVLQLVVREPDTA